MRQGKVQVELDDVEVARAAVAALSYNASSAPFEFHKGSDLLDLWTPAVELLPHREVGR